jgi:hypothetical protein
MRAIGIALGILSVCGATADSQVYSPKAGVGMAFTIANPAGQLAGSLNVFVPLNLGTHFRLEPQIGWHTSSFDEVASDPSSPANGLSGSTRVLLLGVGFLGTQRPGDGATILYYGPRIGLAWTRGNLTDGASGSSLTETQSSWYGNMVVGGEHLFSHLSIGGEVGLGYLHNGTPHWTQSGPATFSASDVKGHDLGTNATALVRWYFGS